MADGLSTPSITQCEFEPRDHATAEYLARKLGFTQTVYTSTSGLWGLFCLPENHEPVKRSKAYYLPPYAGGVIIKTTEFGFLFVQNSEDLHLGYGFGMPGGEREVKQ